MFAWLDHLLTPAWFWRLARIAAEFRLAKVLDCHGDMSLHARAASVKFSRIAFAEQYGRLVHPALQHHVECLMHRGVSLSDLRILVVNKVFIFRDEHLEIRSDVNFERDYWVGWATIALGVAFFSLLVRCLLSYCIATPWVGIAMGTAAMSLGYYFLSLYTIRPYVALRRHQKVLLPSAS